MGTGAAAPGKSFQTGTGDPLVAEFAVAD